MNFDPTIEIMDYISASFLVDFNEEVNINTDLFRSGFIDSMGYVQLVSFLEKTYSIQVGDDALVDDTLVSVSKIVTYVRGAVDDQ